MRAKLRVAISVAVLSTASGCGILAGDRQDRLVSTHLAVLSVEDFDAAKRKLSPAFKLTGDDALKLVNPTIGASVESQLDSLRTAGELGLDLTPTGAGTAGTTPPALPGSSPATAKFTQPQNFKDVLDQTSSLRTSRGLEYQLAQSLFEQVAMLNATVAAASVPSGYKGYIVQLQLGIMPRMQDLPRDVYADIAFFAVLKDAPGVDLRRSTEQATLWTLVGGKKEILESSARRIRVVPLLSTDTGLSGSAALMLKSVVRANPTVTTGSTRTHNAANELLTRDTDSNSSVNYTLAYDDVGNLTDDGKDYKFVYDAFGRLRTVKNQSNTVVAEYTYNGLNMRIGWHYDADTDVDVDGTDPWYSFAMDDRWRIVATFRGSDTSPKELFAYHNAGANGRGGSSYIDSVILRNRDANTAWTSASDGTLEERIYYVQNWRADVSAVLSDAGVVKEWVKYTSYGIPFRIDPGDYNRDGYVNGNDLDDYGDDFDNTRAEADVDFDGDVDEDDYDLFSEWWDAPSTAGRFTLSASSIANRIGYAGYQYDPTFVGASRAIYHVRNRVYDAGLGRWLRRDPLGYVDGVSFYQSVRSSPWNHVDPSGLGCKMCFDCTLQSDVANGAGGLRRLCTYLCKENTSIPRKDTSHGTIDCSDVPQPAYFLDYETQWFSCSTGPRSTCQDVWDTVADAPWRNKGYNACMKSCQQYEDAMKAICDLVPEPEKPFCERSAQVLAALCRELCEAQDDPICTPIGGIIIVPMDGSSTMMTFVARSNSAKSGPSMGSSKCAKSRSSF